ncbi:MAG: nuclear transport factor 2 family protein [Thermoanaerobaculales bacterium]|nr:nuclear transport factor 2 family protein [Thermoanaerobaculales bacterium]
MSLRHSFFVVLAVFFLVACAAPPAEEPGVDLAAEAQAIRDASAAWLAASQARDAATIDGFYAADVTTIYDGEIHQGLAEIQASREEEWASRPDATVIWTTTEVEVAASGDLAYERGYWTTDPDGAGEAPEENGEYLTVWKKIDGQWKVMKDAGTTIKAEEGAAG